MLGLESFDNSFNFGSYFLAGSHKATYNELNEKIERTSKLMHFAMTRLTVVGFVAPFLLTSAINYFIYDLAAESFYLPFPVM